ncbi:hypothetical protein CS0771_15990 [Catellatospora sp. IY07-71]|uniref:hypothetical protein n=1 Tax=Catellatospora sp. IY07-71 TaxID=2728827 RepID=UPI001BB38CCD|nr:hypothetical protein [Catellatospora sp. IY07-71]BCJ72055.1 hypothetical protein CS0771_15990 [Catellatospora sp. IY07-71]
MTGAEGAPQERRRGPRRDAAGRIVSLSDLLGYVLAGWVISMLGLLAFDGLFALLGLGEFGQVTGWLGLIYPVIVFVEQFRAAAGERGRIAVAPAAGLVAVVLGLVAVGLAGGFAPLVTGGLGSLVATVAYAVLWHTGLTVAGRD